MSSRSRLIPPRLLCLSIGFCVASLTAVPALAQAPATQPMGSTEDEVTTPENMAKDQRETLAKMAKQQPRTPPGPVDQFLKFDIADGHLQVMPVQSGPVEINFEFPGEANKAFAMNVYQAATQPPLEIMNAHLVQFDAAASRALDVSVAPVPGQMGLVVTIETLAGATVTQMQEKTTQMGVEDEAPNAQLYIQRMDTPGQAEDANVRVSESNFATLVVLHHDAALAMLGEGLTAMHGMHVLAGVSQADARAIFDANRAVDATTQTALDDIVEAVRKGGREAIPEQRARLRKLGSPAALALHKRSRDNWSVDLGVNIDTLTADLMPGEITGGDALLTAPERLIDLLYSPDAQLRHAALTQLTTLVKDLPKIDAEADPYAIVPQIESLRLRVKPTTAPAANAR